MNFKIIFVDELIGLLDLKLVIELLKYLVEINLYDDVIILMVIYDLYMVSFCNCILFIKDGVIFLEVVC